MGFVSHKQEPFVPDLGYVPGSREHASFLGGLPWSPTVKIGALEPKLGLAAETTRAVVGQSSNSLTSPVFQQQSANV